MSENEFLPKKTISTISLDYLTVIIGPEIHELPFYSKTNNLETKILELSLNIESHQNHLVEFKIPSYKLKMFNILVNV